MAAATNAADGSLDLVISFLRLADPLLGLPDNQRKSPIFRSPSAKYRMRNHDRARNADEMHSGRLARLGSNPDPDTMITRRWSAIGGCASALARSHPLLGEKECGLLCATSPSESSPSLTRARYAGTAGLPGPSQYPARYATPNCHLIDSRASGDNGGFALQPPPKLDGSRFLFCSGGMGG